MNEQLVPISARCEDCEKLYRVPRADYTYTCKACGGSVHAEEETSHPDEVASAEELRHETLAQLRKAYSFIGSISMLYRLGAIAYAAVTLIAVMSLADTDVPEGGGKLVVVLTTLMTVMLLFGAMHVQFMPYLWTIAIAVLATIVTAVHLVGANPFGVAFLGSACWAGLAWAALAPARRFSNLIDEHKDEYILHHASAQTRRALTNRTPEQRHERLLRAMRRASMRTWRISVAGAIGVVLASGYGSYSVLANARPELFEPSLESFESAWSRGDLAAIGELFEPRVRDTETERLTGFLTGHGWRPTPPKLPEGVTERTEDQVAIDYAFGDVTMKTSWARVDLAWYLVRVELPIPSLEPTFRDFVAAWDDSDLDRLVGFFAADARAKMRTRIETAVEERGWITYPFVEDTRLGELVGNQRSATLTLSMGDLRTDWHYRAEGVWRLHGLKFPKK
jgi:hypothetical protein